MNNILYCLRLLLKLFTFNLLLVSGPIMSNAQDWADLEYYRFDNAKIKMMSEPSSKIVMMGNSITEFWSEIRPHFFKDSNFINRGISGQTTPQMLLRFRSDVIELDPDMVIILAGINDIAGNTGPVSIQSIANNIFSMVELAQVHNIKVAISSVLPANRFSWQEDILPANKVISLNEKLKAYAEQQNLTYIDYYSLMVDKDKGLKKELGEDGVHPNAEGYKIMEGLLTNVLADILKK